MLSKSSHQSSPPVCTPCRPAAVRLADFTCPSSMTLYPLLPSLAVWPINSSIIKELLWNPPLCSRLLRLSALMKTESAKNRRTGCLVNTYITKQAPEVEADSDEGEKEKRGFFSLLNFSHSQTLEAPVWGFRWFHPDAPCRLLKRNKELRICHMSLQCWGKTSSSAAYKHWCLVSGLVFLGQAPWSALTTRMISNRS